ncbi:MAG: hypothetical protein ACETV1_03515 [Candidatus Bathyarchaeia archaeon]
MSKKMRSLVGAAYYLVFLFVIGYMFGNIAGIDLMGSLGEALHSALAFVQQLIS